MIVNHNVRKKQKPDCFVLGNSNPDEYTCSQGTEVNYNTSPYIKKPKKHPVFFLGPESCRIELGVECVPILMRGLCSFHIFSKLRRIDLVFGKSLCSNYSTCIAVHRFIMKRKREALVAFLFFKIFFFSFSHTVLLGLVQILSFLTLETFIQSVF